MRDDQTRSRNWRELLLTALAALTCPCHIPVAAIVLGGTAVGGVIAAHQGWLIAGFGLIYVGTLAILFGLPRWRGRCSGPACQARVARASGRRWWGLRHGQGAATDVQVASTEGRG